MLIFKVEIILHLIGFFLKRANTVKNMAKTANYFYLQTFVIIKERTYWSIVSFVILGIAILLNEPHPHATYLLESCILRRPIIIQNLFSSLAHLCCKNCLSRKKQTKETYFYWVGTFISTTIRSLNFCNLGMFSILLTTTNSTVVIPTSIILTLVFLSTEILTFVI